MTVELLPVFRQGVGNVSPLLFSFRFKRTDRTGTMLTNTMKVIPRTALICVAAAVSLNYRATAEIQRDGACPLLVLLPFSTTYVLFSQLKNTLVLLGSHIYDDGQYRCADDSNSSCLLCCVVNALGIKFLQRSDERLRISTIRGAFRKYRRSLLVTQRRRFSQWIISTIETAE